MKCLQAGLLWGMILVGSVPLYADTTWVAAGSVSGHWTVAGNPYLIYDGWIEVPAEAELTIDPGVEMIFSGPFAMTVRGRLNALGTVSDGIHFTGLPTDSIETAWRGVAFISTDSTTADSSRLSYCLLERAGGPGYLSGTGGAVQCIGASPQFENCTFRHNRALPSGRTGLTRSRHGGAAYLTQSNAQFTDCEFSANNPGRLGLGGAVYCDDGTAATFLNCAMQNDTAGGGGAIAVHGTEEFSYPRFAHCEISFNFAYYNGGGAHLDSCNAHLDTCTVSYNSSGECGGGIYVYQENISRLTGCTIYGNDSFWGGGAYSAYNSNFSLWHCAVWNNTAGYGGGIYLYQTWTGIYNCTVSFNTATQGSGGGMFIYESPSLLSNTIVSHSNEGEGLYFLSSPSAVIWYCDFGANPDGPLGSSGDGDMPADLGVLSMINANGDSCDSHRNIYLDPAFTDGSNGDFSLNWDSPCIDAGDPITGQDPDGTLPDIGAFYRDVATADPERAVVQRYALNQNYPNPFNAVTRIEFDLSQTQQAELAVYDLTGRRVTTLLSGALRAGHHSVNWDAVGFSSGVYICRLHSTSGDFSRKMVLLK
jgi:hypothetical protein